MTWQPATESERYRILDVLRGLALLGVLTMNLIGSFRISLFDYMQGNRHTGGFSGELIDQALDALVESKAFILFSLLFGAGAAIQAERAAARGINVHRFLLRRFSVLLLFGLAHVVLLWNGDILMLYAVCGLVLIPLLAVPRRWVGIAGLLLILTAYVTPLPVRLPTQEAMKAQAAQATRVYGQGSVGQIFLFRLQEARDFIVPLWLASFTRTAGLMLTGAAVWRSGLLAHPADHTRALRVVLILCAAFALLSLLIPWALSDLGETVFLAFAYAAGALLWFTPRRLEHFSWIAATGQMAFTNYLMQSLVLSLIFYGFGLGLFGKLTPGAGLLIAFALYAAQTWFSQAWLNRFRFGPMEWLWRSLTYGRRQPMRRS